MIQRTPTLAMVVAGLCAGITLLIMHGQRPEGVFGFLGIWFWGYFATVLVVLVAGALTFWYMGDEHPETGVIIIIASATIIAVCAWLVAAKLGIFRGDEYDYW